MIIPEPAPRPFQTIETDAVIVGSGAGGAVIARELAEAGLSVAVIEEGGYHDAAHYGKASPMEAARMLYRKGGMTFTVGGRPIHLPIGRTVGGTTVINSGTTLRAAPEAVDRWRSEFGLLDLTDHLDTHYERVEEVSNVRPVPDGLFNRQARLFRAGTEALGWRGSVLTRNERGCRGAGRCFLGCPNNAKQAVHLSYLPRATRAGARIYTRVHARRVRVRQGRVEGLHVSVGALGYPAFFMADTVFLCAGALFTPHLLHGIANRHAGRHLKVHPSTRVIGEFAYEVRGWEGVPQAYHVDEFFRDGISLESIFLPRGVMGSTLPGFGRENAEILRRYDRLVIIGVRTFEDAEGTVHRDVLGLTRSWPAVTLPLARSDVDRLRRAVGAASRILFAAGALRVFTGVHGHEILTGMGDLKRLEHTAFAASDFELVGHHAQGTARMADDPARGACDPEGRVWGVQGLYVADAASMPSTPQSNPQLSIQAFATHVAERHLRRAGRALVERDHVHAGDASR